MSLSIWHQLDTPRHPLMEENIREVRLHAEFGWTRTRLAQQLSYRRLLSSRFVAYRDASSGSIEPLEFIGYTIGIRAAKLGLKVDNKDSNGYQFNGVEMEKIRKAESLGVRAGELAANAEPPKAFDVIMNEVLGLSGPELSTESSVYDNPEELIGFGAGYRNFQPQLYLAKEVAA